MKAGGRVLLILVSAATLLASCLAEPRKVATGPIQPQAVAQPVQAPQTEQVLQTEQAGSETKAVEKAPAPAFVATEDLYKKTFNEVQEVIAALTRIIAAGDYGQWLTYLTADYITTTGSAEFLAAASNAGIIKKSGIALKSLEDYFNMVVVPSRLQATLDDLTFIDATHVKAKTMIQGSLFLLYYLVREDNRWKIGILREDSK